MTPLFTVAIPAHNCREHVPRALESLLAQTRRDWEAIVVDDGSTDDTPRVVERFTRRFDGRLTLVRQACQGPLAARQSAYRLARGRYVLSLDADDAFHPRLMERLAQVLEQTSADLVLFDTTRSLPWPAGGGAPDHPTLAGKGVLDRAQIRAMFARGEGRRVWEYCIERELLLRSLVDEDTCAARFGEDNLQCCLVCGGAESLVYLPERLHYYHKSQDGLSGALGAQAYRGYAGVARACREHVRAWDAEGASDGTGGGALEKAFCGYGIKFHAFAMWPRLGDGELLDAIAEEGFLSACLACEGARALVGKGVLAKARMVASASENAAARVAARAAAGTHAGAKRAAASVPSVGLVREQVALLGRRNRYILGKCPDRPALPNRVNVEEWRTPQGGPNLGDALSPVVVDWMLARKGLLPATEEGCRGTKFLAAVGSVLGFGVNDSCVWGAGLLGAGVPWNLRAGTRRLDIRAVRGPLTRGVLMRAGHRVPEVYGDPAVLMPLIYQPKQPCSGMASPEVLVIGHHESGIAGTGPDPRTDDYRSFVDAVAAARIVVSSSLHAIILAEMYGVPAVLLYDGRPKWDLFKYRDWYESTGRTDLPVAVSAEDALNVEPAPLPDPALLEEMREALLAAFPYDLWDLRA